MVTEKIQLNISATRKDLKQTGHRFMSRALSFQKRYMHLIMIWFSNETQLPELTRTFYSLIDKGDFPLESILIEVSLIFKKFDNLGYSILSLLNCVGCVGPWVAWVAWVRGYVGDGSRKFA